MGVNLVVRAEMTKCLMWMIEGDPLTGILDCGVDG